MKTRNIAFICPSTAWGGLEMNVHRLAIWLKKRGYHIILHGNPLSILYQKLQAENISVRPLVSRSKFMDIFRSRNLAKLLKADSATVVILHMNKNFLLAVLAKIFSGNFFRLLYMQHMHVGPTKKDFFHNWLYRRLDKWITLLPLFKRSLSEKTNIPPEKIEIIPFGIELNRFIDHLPGRSTARQKLNLPSHALIAGVVGRLDPKKGQHVLIEACRRVHDAGTPLHLLFVGDKSMHEETGYAERLDAMVDEFALSDYVHFRPHLVDIEYAYAAMDIFVLTSQSETYGMVTIEAMASGLPIIATAAGGTIDIVDGEGNGLLVPPLKAAELHKALMRIITDSELARTLAAKARRDAIEKFSHVHQCDMLEEIFEELPDPSA